MADLSHWDFAEQFSGYDAAALILGFEPRDSEEFQGRINVVVDRMGLHYECALDKARIEQFAPSWETEPIDTVLSQQDLPSVELLKGWQRSAERGEDGPFHVWLSDRRKPLFENQEFSREKVANWLAAIGMRSRYAFKRDADEADAIEHITADFDPSDSPPELDAANMAFRAVIKGYGDPAATPRNRLVEYLEKNYPDFKPEQVQRIATVANPDKTTGRKRSGKE
jgi:hypothetical protein